MHFTFLHLRMDGGRVNIVLISVTDEGWENLFNVMPGHCLHLYENKFPTCIM